MFRVKLFRPGTFTAASETKTSLVGEQKKHAEDARSAECRVDQRRQRRLLRRQRTGRMTRWSGRGEHNEGTSETQHKKGRTDVHHWDEIGRYTDLPNISRLHSLREGTAHTRHPQSACSPLSHTTISTFH